MKIKKITAALSALAIVMTSAAFSISAETEPLLYGDATCDSEVDIRDITAVNQHIVKLVPLSEQGIKNCDLFGTGDVTLKDLGQMKKYMIKVIKSIEPQISKSEISAEVIELSANEFEGSALYKSADELPDGIVLDDGFFDENYLYIERIVTVDDDNISFKTSVKTEEDGSLTVDVIQMLTSLYHTDLGMVKYCVAVTIPKSMYNGQDININVEEKCSGVYDSFLIKDVNMLLDLYNNPSLSEPKIFTNYEDFKEYIDEMCISVYTTDGECYTSSAPEELYKYDEDFFENNALLIKMSEQPAGITSIESSTVSMNTEGNFKAYVNMEFEYNVDYAPRQFPVVYFVGAEIPAEECRDVLTEFEVDVHMLPKNNIYSDFQAIECGYTGEHLSEGRAYTSADELPYDVEGLEKYDDKFFENNVLYIQYEPFSSISDVPVPKSVEINQYGNFILNVYDKCGFAGADAMNGYYLCFSLPKYVYSGQRFADVVHYSAVYENESETDSDAEISAEIIQNPESLNTDDFVNFLNPEGVYSTEIIKDYDSFKKHITGSSPELDKYNEEFFENNNAVIFKYNSYAYEYHLSNVRKTDRNMYNIYFDQLCMDCVTYSQQCMVLTVPESADADFINIIFNNMQ